MVVFREVCKLYQMEPNEAGRVAYLLLMDRNFNFRLGKSGMLKYLIKHEKSSAETLQAFMLLYEVYEKKKLLLKNLDTVYG
jgi:hypothetical protein